MGQETAIHMGGASGVSDLTLQLSSEIITNAPHGPEGCVSHGLSFWCRSQAPKPPSQPLLAAVQAQLQPCMGSQNGSGVLVADAI